MSVLILCDPMDRSPPGSSSHRMFQARKLEWLVIFSFRGSSWPRGQTCVSCIAGGFFTTELPGKPQQTLYLMAKYWKIPSWDQDLGVMLAITLPVHYYSGDHIASAIKQEKERKLIKIGKEEVKLSQLANGIMLYKENPKDSINRLLVLINIFHKVAGYKINT